MTLGTMALQAIDWDGLAEATTEGLLLDPVATLDRLIMHNKWSLGQWLWGSLVKAGILDMARGKGQKSTVSKESSGGWTTFIDISLAGHDVEASLDKYQSADSFYDGVAGMIEDGYRFSLVYNPNNDAVICSVTCKNEDSPNHGCTFNAFADTWYDAIRIALVKHFEVAGEKWMNDGRKAVRPKYG